MGIMIYVWSSATARAARGRAGTWETVSVSFYTVYLSSYCRRVCSHVGAVPPRVMVGVRTYNREFRVSYSVLVKAAEAARER